jgi:hypothetical protein
MDHIELGPGANLSFYIESKPNSLLALTAIDQRLEEKLLKFNKFLNLSLFRVLLLRSGNDFSKRSVFLGIDRYTGASTFNTPFRVPQYKANLFVRTKLKNFNG